MKGKCLCGLIEFDLKEDIPNLYQCHCSLCRKVTGSSANAAFRISADQLLWKNGVEQIREFITETGFKSHFCNNCGSPLPNLTANDSAYWVPVGLLEDSEELTLVAHLFIDSRAKWDVVADTGEHFAEMPDAETLDRLLRPTKTVI
ncbi:MAG: GFA family protein [Gammaproteobacteria bacterium]|nr:GFA family protein [Gammaproteobacteria bacterium]